MTDRRERMTVASPLRGRQQRNDNSAQSIRIKEASFARAAQSSELCVAVQQRQARPLSAIRRNGLPRV
jgi:hypothetical protein